MRWVLHASFKVFTEILIEFPRLWRAWLHRGRGLEESLFLRKTPLNDLRLTYCMLVRCQQARSLVSTYRFASAVRRA